ncbi:MAG: CoA pyrophosphatase [Candidatus Heimdallarchaeum aukensis]|uniref:CoA pyrophosphatase n=1 Tax=Candidatus Heimdallarchaeum aukensis TaxID=2876573 RepID=A0A9Y1FLY4_9ARCH|nr:MAG: CoA pyrophosphatase [Candidatus Heimdallarchaeum aukensis]
MNKSLNYEAIKLELIPLDAPIKKIPELKLGTVLIPIFPSSNQIMFTKRSNKMKNHPGQISFPGGAVEEGETIVEACLRETNEEVGINNEKIQLLGRLPPLATSSNFFVYPIVGLVESDVKISVNPDEVEKVFFVQIEELLNDNNKVVEKESDSSKTYYLAGNYTIWGVTAQILEELFSTINKIEN